MDISGIIIIALVTLGVVVVLAAAILPGLFFERQDRKLREQYYLTQYGRKTL